MPSNYRNIYTPKDQEHSEKAKKLHKKESQEKLKKLKEIFMKSQKQDKKNTLKKALVGSGLFLEEQRSNLSFT